MSISFTQQQKKRHNAGFSLIEVLVSLSIFTIVVGMAVGTTMVLIDANAKAQNTQLAVTNLAFTFDAMSREIRTGTFYYGDFDGNPASGANGNTRDCESLACNTISFIEAGDSLTGSCRTGGRGRIAYRFNAGAIERRLCAGSWEVLTAPELVVNAMHFTVAHTDRTDDRSPLVTIFADVTVQGTGLTESDIQMQSSVTQQAIDI